MEIVEEKKSKSVIPKHIQQKLALLDKITELSITKKLVLRKVEQLRLLKKTLSMLVIFLLALLPVSFFIPNPIWITPVFLITSFALFLQIKEYRKLSIEIEESNQFLDCELDLIEHDIASLCSDGCASTSLDDKVRMFYNNLINSITCVNN